MIEIKRQFYHTLSDRLRTEKLPFMQVLIGPRQVGKSTAIRQIANEWKGPAVIESADQISPPDTSWIEFVWQRAREMPAPCLLAIDEIQKIQRWSDAIKILFDRDRNQNQLRVILSGSASLSLQQGLTESLAGRYELIRCAHWGLDECSEAFGWDLTTYLKFGGYPAAASLIGDERRWQEFIRDGIVEPVIGRDLQSSIRIQKPALLRQLFALTMLYPSQEISFQKLLGQLQDRGNAATIKHYLEILAGGFMLASLEKFSTSPLRQKSSSPKILPMAPALIHAFSSPSLVDSDPQWRGRLFETAIGTYLHRLSLPLFYWREGKDEVDFVIEGDRQLIAIEVKSGRQKSGRGLIAFKQKFPKASTILIDWDRGRQLLSHPPSLDRLMS